VFEESLVWSLILQPIPHKGKTCFYVIDGKFQLKHASAAKKEVTRTRIKNIRVKL